MTDNSIQYIPKINKNTPGILIIVLCQKNSIQYIPKKIKIPNEYSS